MSKKRIRARKMWVYTDGASGAPAEPWQISPTPSSTVPPAKPDMPCYVLPATAEAYEQMVEQAARAIFGTSNDISRWPRIPYIYRLEKTMQAKDALRAIGITPPKKGRT